MTTKEQILLQLENTKIPDLKFLFSKEVLDVALETLGELLDEERKDFDDTLIIKDFDITFETFQDFSRLDLFFSLLNHLQNVKSGDQIRNIIEQFDPKYVDFGNYIAYNKRYYDMICYCRENCDLDLEQKRILDLSIKAYKVK
jgi:Zn-dependent oligopeptidase